MLLSPDPPVENHSKHLCAESERSRPDLVPPSKQSSDLKKKAYRLVLLVRNCKKKNRI